MGGESILNIWGVSIWEVLAWFLIYSVIGWCMEVVYVSIQEKRFQNRGFLNGAILPIYGTGAVMMIYLLEPVRDHIWLVALLAMVVATAWELIIGWLLDVIFHMRWWDYSKEKWNLGGYICAFNAVAWGVCGVVLIYGLQPLVSTIVGWVPEGILQLIVIIAGVVILLDFVTSLMAIYKWKSYLREVGDVLREGSTGLAEGLGGFAIEADRKWEEFSKEADKKFKKNWFVRRLKYTKRGRTVGKRKMKKGKKKNE